MSLVTIALSGAMLVKGSSVKCDVMDVVLENGEDHLGACVVGREFSTYQYGLTWR